MPDLIVTSREELDDALAKHAQDLAYRIVIDSPEGVWLPLDLPGGNKAQISVRGHSSVGPVGGSATVSGVGGSATVSDVWGSATVRGVWGSATVRGVWGSATVRDVWGSATVSDVGGSATVSGVSGTAVLRLYDRVKASHVGPYVTVLVHSQTVTVDGGHIVDLYSLDQTDPTVWCHLTGVTVDEDGAHLYKAVDDDYQAGHSYTPIRYPVGETVTDPAWKPKYPGCGYGLHTCPTPRLARDHYSAATRFLEVVVPLAELVPIDETKCKSRSVRVLREVTIDGEPVSA